MDISFIHNYTKLKVFRWESACHKANPNISYLISNRLSRAVGGNREMD